jgi:hypothetical protein
LIGATLPALGVGDDYAGADRESFAAHESFGHAARHYGFEQLAQEIALAETAVAVLGKRRMIGHSAVETQAAEPAISQIEVDLLTQPTLRTNAEAVADDEHPDHQLGINRGPPDVAVIGLEMRPNSGQVDETVDPAQHVIVRDVPVQTEAVEQRLLHHTPFAHHRPNLLHPAEENQRPAPRSSGAFQRNSQRAVIRHDVANGSIRPVVEAEPGMTVPVNNSNALGCQSRSEARECQRSRV